MCRKEKRNIQDFIKDCDIHWSRSYCSFLISFYKFVKLYPKFKNVTISIYFMSKHFSVIKNYIENDLNERLFWMQ
jgi:hypothetical protein